MKRPRKNLYVDLFHKGFVCTCIAVTIYGTMVLGSRYYNYFTEYRPKVEQMKLQEKEELLAEGSSAKIKDLA